MKHALEWLAIIWVCGGCFIPLLVLGDWIAYRLERAFDPTVERPPA